MTYVIRRVDSGSEREYRLERHRPARFLWWATTRIDVIARFRVPTVGGGISLKADEETRRAFSILAEVARRCS